MSNLESYKSDAPPTAPQAQRKRILWVKSGPLLPANTGGRIRTWQMLRAIQKDHDVTYLALGAPDSPNPRETTASDLQEIHVPWRDAPRKSPSFFCKVAWNMVASSQPYVLWKYRSKLLQQRIHDFDQSGRFDLMVCDFLTPALNFRLGERQTPAVLFEHNIEALIWERMAATAGNVFSRRYLSRQFARMHDWEGRLARRFDGVITVSPDDTRLARDRYALTNVLGDVPTGVDSEFFASVRRSAPDGGPPVLGFLGSMDWLPNIDGIRWFLTSVWPALKQKNHGLRMSIIGRNPPEELRRLASADPAVTFTGTVDDVRPALAECRAMVVPLRVGGGTRLKILEMMAAGLPVVSTTVGAEGLPLVSDRHLLIADTEEEFAAKTHQLLNDPALQAQLVGNALGEIVSRSSWKWCADVFMKLCATIDRNKPAGR